MYVNRSDLKIRDVMNSSVLVKLPLGNGCRLISSLCSYSPMSLESTQNLMNSRSFHFPPKSGAARTRGTLTYSRCLQIGLFRHQSLAPHINNLS